MTSMFRTVLPMIAALASAEPAANYSLAATPLPRTSLRSFELSHLEVRYRMDESFAYKNEVERILSSERERLVKAVALLNPEEGFLVELPARRSSSDEAGKDLLGELRVYGAAKSAFQSFKKGPFRITDSEAKGPSPFLQRSWHYNPSIADSFLMFVVRDDKKPNGFASHRISGVELEAADTDEKHATRVQSMRKVIEKNDQTVNAEKGRTAGIALYLYFLSPEFSPANPETHDQISNFYFSNLQRRFRSTDLGEFYREMIQRKFYPPTGYPDEIIFSEKVFIYREQQVTRNKSGRDAIPQFESLNNVIPAFPSSPKAIEVKIPPNPYTDTVKLKPSYILRTVPAAAPTTTAPTKASNPKKK